MNPAGQIVRRASPFAGSETTGSSSGRDGQPGPGLRLPAGHGGCPGALGPGLLQEALAVSAPPRLCGHLAFPRSWRQKRPFVPGRQETCARPALARPPCPPLGRCRWVPPSPPGAAPSPWPLSPRSQHAWRNEPRTARTRRPDRTTARLATSLPSPGQVTRWESG